ncbi:MAG: hypothetical protein JWR72_3096 [Flavisolibacter sp.]|jgi:hypothetical protein|nr:hypothetical protein [Flavisolibacter sp.]
MENNQQNKSEINTSINDGDTFSNQQPGQQLPTNGEASISTNSDELLSKEQHSESSMPDGKNETLGTP